MLPKLTLLSQSAALLMSTSLAVRDEHSSPSIESSSRMRGETWNMIGEKTKKEGGGCKHKKHAVVEKQNGHPNNNICVKTTRTNFGTRGRFETAAQKGDAWPVTGQEIHRTLNKRTNTNKRAAHCERYKHH